MAQRRIVYQNTSFDISYERILRENKAPILLFLHGWGSNKELMKVAFGKCFGDFEHLYVDMPGFGNSPNETPLFTHDYARIIEDFVREVVGIEARECVIVGHSFGGKVATLIAPKEMILLSSAGIKVPKSLKVRLKIALAKILKTLGLSHLTKAFRSSDVSAMNEGMYKTFKNVVDEDFLAHFTSFKGRASIFWGREDTATPLFCGERMAEAIESSRFFVLEGDHYFFLKQGAEVERLYKQNQSKDTIN